MKGTQLIQILLLLGIIIACLISTIKGQVITFENQGLNSNQVLNNPLTIDGYVFRATQPMATNYGSFLNINEVSLYFYFQNSTSDYISIFKEDNSRFDCESILAYQVSEIDTNKLSLIGGYNIDSLLTYVDGLPENHTLVVTGFSGDTTKYKNLYYSVNFWRKLTLNFEDIDSIILSIRGSEPLGDYNFDDFSFIPPINRDTLNVTLESIGHTDSAYTNYSYKVYNKYGEYFLGDNIFQISSFGDPMLLFNANTTSLFDFHAEISNGEIVFGGDTSYATYPSLPIFASNSWTIIIKLNPTRGQTADFIPLWSNKNGIYGYGIRLMMDNRIQIGIGDNVTATQDIYSIDSVKVGQENYIAITFDGVNFRFYFEGILSNTVPYPLANPFGGTTMPDNPIYIGSYGRATTVDWYDGTMKELQVYNICLQSDQLVSYPIPLNLVIGITRQGHDLYKIEYMIQDGIKKYVHDAYMKAYLQFDPLMDIPSQILISN